jgi:hypothetical protein
MHLFAFKKINQVYLKHDTERGKSWTRDHKPTHFFSLPSKKLQKQKQQLIKKPNTL